MAAGYTTLTYNGITIEQCLTRMFRQEPVFDPSDTNLLFYKFTVQVVGYVHGKTGSFGGVRVSGTTGSPNNAASFERAIRVKLAENRQSFEMRVGITSTNGGTVLLSAVPVPPAASPESMSGYDLNNGPKCRGFEISRIVGNEIFEVQATFEVCVMECDREGRSPNTSGVLSNQWTVTDEVDTNLFTTRAYRGQLRTFTGQINVQSFRHYVVPPLQSGLQRQRMDFEVSEDGLTLNWSVVDQEVAFSAPHPATNWNYRYSESFDAAMVARGELAVMLEGDRNVDKQKLIQIAMGMVKAKLLRGGNNSHLLESQTIAEESGSNQTNRITVHARMLHVTEGKEEDLKQIKAIPGNMGRPIDAAAFDNIVANYDANISRGGGANDLVQVEGPIGMAGVFAAYLQRPCATKHKIAESGFTPGVAGANAQKGIVPPADRPSLSVRVVPSIPVAPSDYLSKSQTEAIYTFWKMDSEIDVKEGRVAMPIAGSSVDSLRSSGSSAPRDTVAIIGLHDPIAMRVVRLSGERVGQFPELPEGRSFKDGNGITHSLMRTVVRPATTTRTPDGKPFHHVDAEYHYVLSRPPTYREQLEVGTNPWDKLGIQNININYSEEIGKEPITRASSGTGASGGREAPAVAEIPNDQK